MPHWLLNMGSLLAAVDGSAIKQYQVASKQTSGIVFRYTISKSKP
jgi:hypothetical protein